MSAAPKSLAPARMSQQELESYLWGAAIILRGLVDAGDYKQFVFPLVFFKRLSDVWDEDHATALAESGGDAAYAIASASDRFVIPEGAHWNDVRTTPKDVGRALQRALRAIEAANPGRLDGIFGDAQWTNKERLSDVTLKNLLEHFSTHTLSLANVPEDELGNGYEFLIKKFADDSGHTAQEFYTNRTVVHLMVQMLAPQSGDSIYDPTCGTGGMLISALAEVKRHGGEYRTLRLYGQERNHMTASIARMNLVLHGVEDSEIARGDTLAAPAFHEGDRLKTFDVVLANPPYSIKQWNRDAWSTRRRGAGTSSARRRRGARTTRSSSTSSGAWTRRRAARRCCSRMACSFARKRRSYAASSSRPTSSTACSAWGRTCSTTRRWRRASCSAGRRKPAKRPRQGAAHRRRERGDARAGGELPKPEHQERIGAYDAFADVDGFAKVVTRDEIAANDFSLSIPLYVKRATADVPRRLRAMCRSRSEASGQPGKARTCILAARWTAVVDLLDGYCRATDAEVTDD